MATPAGRPVPSYKVHLAKGVRCMVDGYTCAGTIRYIAAKKDNAHPGHKLYMVGMELDIAAGDNDGTMNGHRLFQCPSNCGLFVSDQKITRIVGARCLVEGFKNCAGTIRWLGSLEPKIKSVERYVQTFKVGVELDAPIGMNDGSARSIKRFECKPHSGIFCVAQKILLVAGQVVTVKGFQGAGHVAWFGAVAKGHTPTFKVGVAMATPQHSGGNGAVGGTALFPCSPHTSALVAPEAVTPTELLHHPHQEWHEGQHDDGAEKLTAKDKVMRHLTKTERRTVCCCFVDRELTLPRTCVILPIVLAVALGVAVVLTATTYTVTSKFVQPKTYDGNPVNVEFVHKFGPWKVEDEFKMTNTVGPPSLDFTEIEEAYSGDCSAFTVGPYAKSDCAVSLQERCYVYKYGPVTAIVLNFLVIPTVFFSASWTTIGMLMLGAFGNVAAFFAVTNNMRDDQSYPENDDSACSYGYVGQFSYNGTDYDTTIRMTDGHEVGSGYTMLLIAVILGAIAAVLVEFTVDPAAVHQDDLEKYHSSHREQVQNRATGRGGVHQHIRI